MNANICGTRDKYLFQRLSQVISETHDKKNNICLGIHKYLCFNNHSIREACQSWNPKKQFQKNKN